MFSFSEKFTCHNIISPDCIFVRSENTARNFWQSTTHNLMFLLNFLTFLANESSRGPQKFLWVTRLTGFLSDTVRQTDPPFLILNKESQVVFFIKCKFIFLPDSSIACLHMPVYNDPQIHTSALLSSLTGGNLLTAHKLWGKVLFLHLSVHRGGGGSA